METSPRLISVLGGLAAARIGHYEVNRKRNEVINVPPETKNQQLDEEVFEIMYAEDRGDGCWTNDKNIAKECAPVNGFAITPSQVRRAKVRLEEQGKIKSIGKIRHKNGNTSIIWDTGRQISKEIVIDRNEIVKNTAIVNEVTNQLTNEVNNKERLAYKKVIVKQPEPIKQYANGHDEYADWGTNTNGHK